MLVMPNLKRDGQDCPCLSEACHRQNDIRAIRDLTTGSFHESRGGEGVVLVQERKWFENGWGSGQGLAY